MADRKIIDFKTVKGDHANDVDKAVKDALADGWQPLHGTRAAKFGASGIWFTTVVKYEEPAPTPTKAKK